MRTKKIRMGIVGVGGISRNHNRGIAESPDADLVAICDINEETLKEKSNALGIPRENCFVKYDDLFNSGLIDAVSICTPNNQHVKIAMAALAKKIPFAVEKPVGVNDDEVKKLYQEVTKHNHKHMVCFTYRFKSAVRYARHIVRSGLIGEVRHVYGQYIQNSSFSPDKPLLWRFQKDMAGGGADSDIGVHLRDLVTFITGLDYESVCATAGNIITKRKDPVTKEEKEVTTEDYCNILARFDSGASAVFMISKFCMGRRNCQRIEIYGSKGSIVYFLEDKDAIDVCIGEPYAKSLNFTTLNIPEEFHTDQMQSFFDIINDRGDGLAANLADGLRAQQLITKVMESAKTQKWVKTGK